MQDQTRQVEKVSFLNEFGLSWEFDEGAVMQSRKRPAGGRGACMISILQTIRMHRSYTAAD